MNGTFSKNGFSRNEESLMANGRTIARIAGVVLSGMLAVVAPAFSASATRTANTAAADRPADVSRGVDHAKVENLQRWVSAGHEEWCKDARLVAMDELKRLAPAFAGGPADLDAVPLDTESADGERAVFVWSSPDGRATYRVTVERFGWLLSIAGDANSIVWVPTHAEVIHHR